MSRSPSLSLSLASSLERMELEQDRDDDDDDEPPFRNDGGGHDHAADDDHADAEYGEHHQLFGGGGSTSSRDGEDGIQPDRSGHCCSRHLPTSSVGRLTVLISVACNILFILVRSTTTTTTQGGMSQIVNGNDLDGFELNDDTVLVDGPDEWNGRSPDSTKRTSHNNNEDPTICEKNGAAPCATVLSTFPNSGTTWTQAVYTASTGIVSLTVYPEGPLSPFPPHSYVHGPNQIGPNNNRRLPDPTKGECLFVKTHHRVPYEVLADHHPKQIYQRAVVLYRDPEDNLHANLRYLTKLPLSNRQKPELLRVCNHDPHGAPLPVDTNFDGDWAGINATDYADFAGLHRLAHRRFYCHAERYPAPTMIVTYARLLSDPHGTFRDIMMFSGYASADVERALEENPPRSHEVHGSLDYVPVDLGEYEDEDDDNNNFDNDAEDPCAGLSRRFQKLWSEATPCAKMAAKILQFI